MATEPQWKCGACGESVEADFDVCWSCSAPRDGTEALVAAEAGDATAPAESTFVCRGCGYALDGLEGDRCPECGRPFDPENVATVRRRGWEITPTYDVFERAGAREAVKNGFCLPGLLFTVPYLLAIGMWWQGLATYFVVRILLALVDLARIESIFLLDRPLPGPGWAHVVIPYAAVAVVVGWRCNRWRAAALRRAGYERTTTVYGEHLENALGPHRRFDLRRSGELRAVVGLLLVVAIEASWQVWRIGVERATVAALVDAAPDEAVTP
jgi:hypothetical protein